MSDAAATRWKTFLDKVQARVGELEGEAQAGLEGLVETEVLDPAPLSSALSELKARFHGLTKKVDEAWEKTIEPMLEDAPESEWDALWRQGERLRRHIDRAFTQLEREALAHHARALHEKVKEEAEHAVACSSCGAPLSKRVRPRTVNVTCTHCQAVTTVRPGLATAMFFGGGALHALGVRAAAEQFDALSDAERRFTSYAHQLEEDADAFRAAHETAWRAWAEEKARWVPGTKPDAIAKDVEVKVGQATKHLEQEAHRRGVRSKAMALAARGDVAALVAFMQGDGADAYFSFDDLLECAAEHDVKPALEAALKAQFKAEAPDEPEREFIAEKRRDVLQTVRRRRR
ncbi:MAG: zinc ribbon domain-containing protein [Myxococcaceae bacterium]|nr:zinc ribbon domain-containing protein [Myxococcaceae bacterium]